MTYFIVYLILLFFGFFSINKPNIQYNNIKKSFLLCFFIFVFVAGLRYEIGYDFFPYRELYENYVSLFDLNDNPTRFWSYIKDNSIEPLSTILIVLLKTITDDSQILFFATSFICSVLLFKTLKFFCEPKFFFLSLLIYFSFVYLFQEMHALRQALGASFLYFGLCQYVKGYKTTAIIWVVLSCLFHYSMIIFLPLLFVIGKKIPIKVQLFLIGISFFVFLLRIRWINVFLEHFLQYIPFVSVISKVDGYMNKEALERPFFITFFLYLLPYFYLLFIEKKGSFFSAYKYLIARNMYFFYLIFTMLLWEYTFFSVRYGWICLFGMAICLPKLIDTFSNRYLRKLSFAYIMLFCYIIVHSFLFPTSTNIQFTPYESYVEIKLFGEKGTGKERVKKFATDNNIPFRY